MPFAVVKNHVVTRAGRHTAAITSYTVETASYKAPTAAHKAVVAKVGLAFL
ncbi:MAG: hypothetical protein NTV66_07370 [Methylococcales bacterium]|nr:hypothetical protein [Methylococcales bacterium]